MSLGRTGEKIVGVVLSRHTPTPLWENVGAAATVRKLQLPVAARPLGSLQEDRAREFPDWVVTAFATSDVGCAGPFSYASSSEDMVFAVFIRDCWVPRSVWLEDSAWGCESRLMLGGPPTPPLVEDTEVKRTPRVQAIANEGELLRARAGMSMQSGGQTYLRS